MVLVLSKLWLPRNSSMVMIRAHHPYRKHRPRSPRPLNASLPLRTGLTLRVTAVNGTRATGDALWESFTLTRMVLLPRMLAVSATEERLATARTNLDGWIHWVTAVTGTRRMMPAIYTATALKMTD